MANAFSLSNKGSVPGLATPTGFGATLSRAGQQISGAARGLLGGIESIAKQPVVPTSIQSNVSRIGYTPAGIPTARPQTSGFLPSTPVKAVTAPDGTKTEFHAPTTTSAPKSSPSGSQRVSMGAEQPSQSVPTAGSTFYNPTTGQPEGQNEYDPNTGKPLAGSNIATPSATSSANTVQTANASGTPTGNQPATFPGLLSSITDASQPTAAETYYNNMAVTGKELQNVNQLGQFAEAPMYTGAGINGNPLTPDTAAPDLEGRAAGESALASSLGNLYGSAAQQGETNAIAQQQQRLQGLESAAGLAAPSGSYPFVFNPATGTFTNASTGGVLNAQDAAQAVLSGKMSYDQAKSSLGYLGSTGESQLQSAIKQINPNANITTLQAQGAAQQQVTGTQEQTKAGYQSALQQAQNVGSQLTDLISSFGLNPSDVNAVNRGIQTIAGNISDPRYKALNNYVNSLASLYAQILTPSGGTETDTTRAIASSMLDATASGQSIQNVIQTLDQEAQARIAGTVTSPISSNTSQTTTSSGGWGSLGD